MTNDQLTECASKVASKIASRDSLKGSFLLESVGAEFQCSAVLGNSPHYVFWHSTIDISFNFERDFYGSPHKARQMRDDFISNASSVTPYSRRVKRNRSVEPLGSRWRSGQSIRRARC